MLNNRILEDMILETLDAEEFAKYTEASEHEFIAEHLRNAIPAFMVTGKVHSIVKVKVEIEVETVHHWQGWTYDPKEIEELLEMRKRAEKRRGVTV